MIFTADESVDRQIVNTLRDLNIKTIYIPENSPGIPDNEVLEAANKNQSILITADKDFGELVFLQRKITLGVVLIRLHGLEQDEKARIVCTAILGHCDELPGKFTVISKDRIRIKKYR